MKRTPLPSHTWQEPDADGNRACEDCPTVWKAGYDDPPPWGCKREPLERSEPINPVNADRRRRRRVDGDTEVRHTYGPYHRWVKSRPCYIRRHPDHECGLGPSGHHIKHVGNGGRDPANEVPLCEKAHRELHDTGRETWQDRYGVDLEAAKWEMWDRFRQVRPQMAERLAGWAPARQGA